MRDGDLEFLEEIGTEAERAPLRGSADRPGLCRIGDAISELLANYHVVVEVDAPSPTACWPAVDAACISAAGSVL